MNKVPATRFALQWTSPANVPGALEPIRRVIREYTSVELAEASRDFDDHLVGGEHWLHLGYRLRLVDLDSPFLEYPIDDGLDAFIAAQVEAMLADLQDTSALATVDGAR